MPGTRIDGDAWIEEFQPDVSQPPLYVVMARLDDDEFILIEPVDTMGIAYACLERIKRWSRSRYSG